MQPCHCFTLADHTPVAISLKVDTVGATGSGLPLFRAAIELRLGDAAPVSLSQTEARHLAGAIKLLAR